MRRREPAGQLQPWRPHIRFFSRSSALYGRHNDHIPSSPEIALESLRMHRHRNNSGLTTQNASDFSDAGGCGTTYRCRVGAGVGVNRRSFATNGTLSHHRWVIPANGYNSTSGSHPRPNRIRTVKRYCTHYSPATDGTLSHHPLVIPANG